MKPILTLIAVAIAAVAVASAQTPATGVGFAKVLESNNVRIASFDNQWTAGARGDGFAIYDQQGQPVFVWSGEAFVRESVTVSWSPDSKRVVILDQQGRAAQFYCAELANGQWRAVQLNDYDPKMPKDTRVTKVELGNWSSPTTIEVKVRHLADFPPKPTPEWVEYTTTLNFQSGTASFAAK